MNNKIKTLTAEQEELMHQVRQQWLDTFLKGDTSFDTEAITKGVNHLYELCGLSAPEIHFLESPMACIKKGRDLFGPDCDLSFSSYGNASDAGWCAFYDFFSRIGVVEHAGFDLFRAMLAGGVWDMIQLEGCCLVSARPSKVVLDGEGRMHNPLGAAIEWQDGYCQHYIRGRAAEAWLFEEGAITREKFLAEKNADTRAAMHAIVNARGGARGMMEMLGAEEVDQAVITHPAGEETVRLLKTRESFEEIGGKPFAWVHFVCPSTGSDYLVAVDGASASALEAAKTSRPSIFDEEEDYKWDARS